MLRVIKLKEGTTLLEVVILITILSLMLLGAAQTISVSLRGAQYNKNKILATRHAEELQEWLRGEKEADWPTLEGKAVVSPGNTYCFNNEEIAWPAQAGNCNQTYALQSMYKREVTLILVPTPGETVNSRINVSWIEGGNTYNIPLDTVFTLWE